MIRRPPRSTRTDTLFPYTTLFRSAPQGADSSINSQVPAKLVPHSSYLLASPTDGFAKAQLMSQCLPYHPTDLSPYLPYLPYQRLKPCSPCQALLTQSPFIESLINPSCNRTI